MSILNNSNTSVQKLLLLKEKACNERKNERYSISVCSGTGCSGGGNTRLVDAFQDYLEQKGLQDQVVLRATGCLGFCDCGPIVIIFPQEVFYQKVTEKDVKEIIDKAVLNEEIVEELLYKDSVSGKEYCYAQDIPFFSKQERFLLGNNWKLSPEHVEDYMSLGGYGALVRVLTEMNKETVIEEIKNSLLRGRGGAGFPTAKKWEECFNTVSDKKFIICNADEGDPGAFMDRSILEGNPHLVLEGLIIAGYAIGAVEGIVYVRAEYPLAVKNIKTAIEQAEKIGLIGENILGSGFDFFVSVEYGAGAFVAGESTALIASVEGRVSQPRQKPPHLVERGLLGKPTVINNVETLANVPHIIGGGVKNYSKIGSEKSKGTKIFSLVGKIVNTGLVEVPLGIKLKDIIFDIGGGVKEGKDFKAVQTGGPSGGCLPGSMLELPVDFEELNDAGSMMGSGGMIIMDTETCMVDIARYFLSFLADESCGQCFSCREGIRRMLEIIEGITEGRGTLAQLQVLEELTYVVKDSSKCGLGQTAANPVLSTFRYFKDEYKAHIEEKRCPAGVCRELIEFSIDPELCEGCGRCLKKCPGEAIQGEKKQPHVILTEKCTKCGICLETCRFEAVVKS